MTERYSSVAQAEVEAALGKVVLLAGYRVLLSRPVVGTSGGKPDRDSDHHSSPLRPEGGKSGGKTALESGDDG
jgi:hypothetical protein